MYIGQLSRCILKTSRWKNRMRQHDMDGIGQDRNSVLTAVWTFANVGYESIYVFRCVQMIEMDSMGQDRIGQVTASQVAAIHVSESICLPLAYMCHIFYIHTWRCTCIHAPHMPLASTMWLEALNTYFTKYISCYWHISQLWLLKDNFGHTALIMYWHRYIYVPKHNPTPTFSSHITGIHVPKTNVSAKFQIYAINWWAYIGDVGIYVCTILSELHQPCDKEHYTQNSQTKFHLIDINH